MYLGVIWFSWKRLALFKPLTMIRIPSKTSRSLSPKIDLKQISFLVAFVCFLACRSGMEPPIHGNESLGHAFLVRKHFNQNNMSIWIRINCRVHVFSDVTVLIVSLFLETNHFYMYIHPFFLGGDTYVAHGFCLPVVVSTAARPQLLRLTPGLIFDQICTLEASEGAERVNSWSSRCEISI